MLRMNHGIGEQCGTSGGCDNPVEEYHLGLHALVKPSPRSHYICMGSYFNQFCKNKNYQQLTNKDGNMLLLTHPQMCLTNSI